MDTSDDDPDLIDTNLNYEDAMQEPRILDPEAYFADLLDLESKIYRNSSAWIHRPAGVNTGYDKFGRFQCRISAPTNPADNLNSQYRTPENSPESDIQSTPSSGAASHRPRTFGRHRSRNSDSSEESIATLRRLRKATEDPEKKRERSGLLALQDSGEILSIISAASRNFRSIRPTHLLECQNSIYRSLSNFAILQRKASAPLSSAY